MQSIYELGLKPVMRLIDLLGSDGNIGLRSPLSKTIDFLLRVIDDVDNYLYLFNKLDSVALTRNEFHSSEIEHRERVSIL